MEMKFFNEMMDEYTHKDVRDIIKQEQAIEEAQLLRQVEAGHSMRFGENRADRRARERQERKSVKRKQPA